MCAVAEGGSLISMISYLTCGVKGLKSETCKGYKAASWAVQPLSLPFLLQQSAHNYHRSDIAMAGS